jgi:type VI secretion system protein VasG
VSINLKTLVGRLNEPTRRALEGAAGLCQSRTNYDVEIEHWLVKLLEVADSDLVRICRQYDLDRGRLDRDLAQAIDRLKTGNGRTPGLSPRIVDLVRAAWLYASLELNARQLRSGHLFVALATDTDLARLAHEISPEFDKLPKDAIGRDFVTITEGSPEQHAPASAGEAASGAANGPTTGNSKTPALDQFTIDLTARARRGEIDPVLCRDHEIRQITDILMRRRQNNPILTGEAGVGKTAVVEGFALRIAQGDVPGPLREVAVRSLDLGLLQAGAGVKGEFENRLKSVIEEVKRSPKPIVLFIDEAHTMIGAGGQAGQADAANLLKPALARGELRTIAATTWSEYKKYFEKDAALARRFQVVKVEEPGVEQAVTMLRGLADTLEQHHKLRILDEAIEAAARLSQRYISGRQLPDKAVSLLDTACARVAMAQAATPPALEDARRQIDQTEVQLRVLRREQASGTDHAEKIVELEAQQVTAERLLHELEGRWEREQALVAQIRELRSQLEILATQPSQAANQQTSSCSSTTRRVQQQLGEAESTWTNEGGSAVALAEPPVDGCDESNEVDAKQTEMRSKLANLTAELAREQGEQPLVQVCVDGQIIADVVAAWTGIPVGKMVSDEVQAVLHLPELLGKRVIGQNPALEAISQRIRTSRANLVDPQRPVGVFLLVGPSGVGKTETALALADALFGGERNLVVLNMSEFQEAHTVSTLKGSPPGYVGYGEGGVLTEAVRRKPYSVVLLDEVEKAHPDVMELFYQVFDKGQLEDGEGREIDFKNTVILLTSNAASDTITKLTVDPTKLPSPEDVAEAIRPQLIQVFKPALLARMTVVPYFSLGDQTLRRIVRLQLDRIGRRLEENHRAQLNYSEQVVEQILSRCEEVESGARNIDHILTGTILPDISGELLTRMASEEPVRSVNIDISDDGVLKYSFA